nr:retrovirus-related Pol polyprotein from transposon TNT 1-94 [Tanacetum cinerariifolium]
MVDDSKEDEEEEKNEEIHYTINDETKDILASITPSPSGNFQQNLSVPNQVASVQAKLKTFDALPCLLLKKKELKKFDFVIKDEGHIYLTEEQINQQKKIDEEVKAEATKRKGEIRKEELINLLGPEVDFQDSLNDVEDTRSNQKYLNDLEEEYQDRDLLAKSKRFFKKGSQRFSSAKATKDTQCYKCGRNGHFARDYFSKIPGSSFPLPNQNYTHPRLTSSSHHKTESKYFEAKHNKVKAKLALLSPSALASSSTLVKNKGLIAETYEWDGEDVSSDDNKTSIASLGFSNGGKEVEQADASSAKSYSVFDESIRATRGSVEFLGDSVGRILPVS